HWEEEFRRRTRALQEAQAALFSAKLSTFRESSSVEQLMVHRAKRAYDEAEDKLRIIKKWNRDYDNRVQPLLKQTKKLHTVLGHDMNSAIAYLTRVIDTLHAYVGIAAPAETQTGAPSPLGSAVPEASPKTEP